MSLTAGTPLGPYEITALIGAGGMGEVYRARDTRLQRDVAIKILPEALAGDPDRLARFEREAQVLAALNHPNIAAIYGFEEGPAEAGHHVPADAVSPADVVSGFSGPSGVEGSRTIRALVLELVEGDTLEDRIARGPLPLDEALALARQIVDALEAAHEAGVVHRDLKPANVKITPAGHVKVLDFGLAKLAGPPEDGHHVRPGSPGARGVRLQPDHTAAPTITTPAMMTGVGTILGTAAYMSPEQARGRPVDRRADIWAFGCVLYETLTGRRAFEDEDISLTLSNVLRREPDLTALPVDTPAGVRQALRLCFRKDSHERIQAAGDLRLLLSGALDQSLPPTTGTPRVGRRAVLVGLTGLLLGVVLTGLAVLRFEPSPESPVGRFTLVLPAGQRLAGLAQTAIALSPDGSHLVYVASTGGSQQLYLRQRDRFESRPLLGTEGATSPFFSPDGQWVAFFTVDRLKKIALSVGPPVMLARVDNFGRGGSWGTDGNIVFAPRFDAGLSSMSAAGGQTQPLTTIDGQKSGSHRFPHHVTGASAVLLTVGTGASWDEARIELLDLATHERKVLIEGGSDGRYVSTGHLIYLRSGTLMAVAFDLARRVVTGQPVAMVEGLMPSTNQTGAAQATFTDAGSLMYVAGDGRASGRTLVLLDRRGAEQTLQLPPRPYRHPRLSRDGQRIVLDIDEGNRVDIWTYDLPRGTLTRLTFDGTNNFPLWTSDEERVTFSSNRAGSPHLFWKAADGSGEDEPLTVGDNPHSPGFWSPDGQTLAFRESDPATGSDIWTLSLVSDRKAQPFLRTPFDESNLVFSPDGRWVAYQSNESGRDEVYLQPFPGPGSKVLVSTEGGQAPLWSHDGRELFYRSGDRMMAVAVTTQPTLRALKPDVLFEKPAWMQPFLRDYDVSSDGRRFLMVKEDEQVTTATRVNVVLGWTEELKRLVPTN